MPAGKNILFMVQYINVVLLWKPFFFDNLLYVYAVVNLGHHILTSKIIFNVYSKYTRRVAELVQS